MPAGADKAYRYFTWFNVLLGRNSEGEDLALRLRGQGNLQWGIRFKLVLMQRPEKEREKMVQEDFSPSAQPW